MEFSRRGGMADALGSGPSSFTGVGVQLPPSAPYLESMVNDLLKSDCGYGISAVHQPSKLVRGVRPPLPAPFGGIPEWLKGADCKSAGTAFDGSNPSPTTISKIAHLKRGAFFLQWGRRSRCKP